MDVLPVEIKNLSFAHAGSNRPVLNNINLKMFPGESIGITGLSGSGKTTLAMAVCGLLKRNIEGILEGEIKIYGKNVFDYATAQIGTKVGLVFQNPENQLFSTSVFDEIIFGPENLCLQKQEIEKRAQKSMDLTGTQDLADRHPGQLSGGEKHLVALASVLSLDPDIFIFDEVMSQLDSDNVQRVNKIISILKQCGKSILIIDHELSRLDGVDRLFLMKAGSIIPASSRDIEDYYRELLAKADRLE
ncbi:MAG TPA: ABC transporter ATP-binding protein [Thermoanaerobacterales bacterium]|nr:ABC transporter ATP-binding protein [Thermoanaerobacterales bacterium]